MTKAEEIPLMLHFRRKSDGRYSVKSPDLPGLFLASADLDVLKNEIDIVIRDLFYYNKSEFVDDVHWRPSKDAVFETIRKLAPAKETGERESQHKVTLQRQAA